MEPIKVILIGAGNRGQAYTNLMRDGHFRVVAVAEPVDVERNMIRDLHGIPEENCYTTWEPLLERPRFADLAIIATVDNLHYAPAMKAIELGYHLLLEKPAAPTARECADIANAAKAKGVKVLVGHVLRYTPFFGYIKNMIDEGKLGRVMTIHHCECVANVHQSHSYVRGNWGNTAESAPMILAKSCHDLDILQWLIGSPCRRVQSFGALSYFRRENAPADAPDYCVDGCPHADTCYYNAVALYKHDSAAPNWSWFKHAATKSPHPTEEDIDWVLRHTQYGKCVFKCNNDVVDHQVVNLQFENGATASFNMSAFNEGGRYIRVMGTDGEVYGDMEENTITYFNFATRQRTVIHPSVQKLSGDIAGGHGGGDKGLVEILYRYLAEDYQGDILSEIGISVRNHLIAFAAEQSRLENCIIDMQEYESTYLM